MNMEKYIKRLYVTCSARNLKSLPSRLNNSSSYLKTSLRFITQPDSFDYTKIPSFTPPSEDKVLLKLASEKKAKFTGSTSSTSSALSQIYFMLDDKAAVSLESLPAAFQEMLSTFTKFTKSPTMVKLLPRDNDVYAITKYEPGSKETILSRLGSSMELFFSKQCRYFSMKWLRNGRESRYECC